MRQTPWTSKASSLPSDRIKPQHSAYPSQQPKEKAKEKAVQQSQQVQRLQKLINTLQSGTGKDKDPKGGCFCQARVHPLSPYHPICFQCGLPLCTLNPPQYSCPSCFSPLLSPAARASLIAKLESEVQDTIAKEVAAAQRVIEQARAAAGAFPTLSTSKSMSRTPSTSSLPLLLPPAEPHKVLSLDSKTKKVTVRTSYTPSPPPSRPPEEEDVTDRVPAPPREVEFVRRPVGVGQSAWTNLRGAVKYVPPPRLDDDENENENENETKVSSSSRKKRNKGKGNGKGKENADTSL